MGKSTCFPQCCARGGWDRRHSRSQTRRSCLQRGVDRASCMRTKSGGESHAHKSMVEQPSSVNAGKANKDGWMLVRATGSTVEIHRLDSGFRQVRKVVYRPQRRRKRVRHAFLASAARRVALADHKRRGMIVVCFDDRRDACCGTLCRFCSEKVGDGHVVPIARGRGVLVHAQCRHLAAIRCEVSRHVAIPGRSGPRAPLQPTAGHARCDERDCKRLVPDTTTRWQHA